MARALIREVFLANGFTVKDGQADLKEYVFVAGEELLRNAPGALSEVELDAIESAFDYVFHFAGDKVDGHIAQSICDTLQAVVNRHRPNPTTTPAAPTPLPGRTQ